MYIVELFNKLKNRKKLEQARDFQDEFVDVEPQVELEDALTCRHIFMPIDSTKTVLACSKCGYVIKNDKVKVSEIDKNPFKAF